MNLTKKEKQLQNRFNQSDTHLVVSRWPTKTERFDGIATYTEDTVINFAKYFPKSRFIVLAEKNTSGNKLFELPHRRVLVVRAFDKKRIHLFPQILTWLKFFSKARNVIVHSEFCASGGPHLRLLIIPFLALIRVMGKKVDFYAHNVVDDLSLLSGHLNIKKQGNMVRFLNISMKFYFMLVSLLVDRFVVLEEIIAKRLRNFVRSKEVIMAPHWIRRPKKKLSSSKAKKLLGISDGKTLVVSFGFITSYKGSDRMMSLVKVLEKRNSINIQITLAGGRSPSLIGQKHYELFYRGIYEKARTNDLVKMTGFLSDEDANIWLSAADIVIFPYRVLMGGSGTLQQAICYGKPILVSEPFYQGHKGWFEPNLSKLGLTKGDICFGQSTKKLHKLILKIQNNKSHRLKIVKFVKDLAKQREMERLLPEHYSQVYSADLENNSLIASKKALT